MACGSETIPIPALLAALAPQQASEF
jgi:hypothetical protein